MQYLYSELCYIDCEGVLVSAMQSIYVCSIVTREQDTLCPLINTG